MDYLAYWRIEQERVAAVRPVSAPSTHPSTPVRVVGGQWTPAIQQAAEGFHSRAMVGHWAKKTGSDPAKIRALLRDD